MRLEVSPTAYDLLETTQRKLRNTPREITLTLISQETGLSLSWLSDFSTNKLDDPGIRKVQRLHDYLFLERPMPVSPLKWEKEILKLIPDYRSLRNDLLLFMSVYMIYRQEDCLYVGVSNALRTRLLSHYSSDRMQAAKPTHVELKHYRDMNAAQYYEKLMIKSKQPLFNIASKAPLA